MNPADGPFMSAVDLTRYDDDPGYAIPVRDVTSSDAASRVLDRLGFAATGKAA